MTTTTSSPIQRWVVTVGSAVQAAWPPLALSHALADIFDRPHLLDQHGASRTTTGSEVIR